MKRTVMDDSAEAMKREDDVKVSTSSSEPQTACKVSQK